MNEWQNEQDKSGKGRGVYQVCRELERDTLPVSATDYMTACQLVRFSIRESGRCVYGVKEERTGCKIYV